MGLRQAGAVLTLLACVLVVRSTGIPPTIVPPPMGTPPPGETPPTASGPTPPTVPLPTPSRGATPPTGPPWTPSTATPPASFLTGVVFIPKTIRPGLAAKIQYNFRSYTGNGRVTATILQNNRVEKPSHSRYFSAGAVFTSQISVPNSFTAGRAVIRVTITGDQNFPNTQSAHVTVEEKSLSIFIQTDKTFYKPSQTVNFRVLAVDSNMMPHNGSCDIEIKDAEGNKIRQWKSINLDHGVLTQKLELTDQPVLGDWIIKATINKKESKVKKFTIDKYVLPKFEVSIDAPTFMLETETQFKATIESKYTFGKGVDGTAVVKISNPTLRYWGYDAVARRRLQPKTVELKDLVLIDGKVDVTLSASQLKSISFEYAGLGHGNQFTIEANVTEKLTGITKSAAVKAVVKVYASIEKIEFLSSAPSNFKPGLNYTGFVKLSQVDGGVVSNPKAVNIRVEYKIEQQTGRFSWNRQTTSTYKDVAVSFPQNGLTQFSLDVPTRTRTIILSAKYDGKNSVQAVKTLQASTSRTQSFVQLTLLSKQLQINSWAHFKISSTKPGQAVDYQIWARGSMVSSGNVKVDTQSIFSVQMLPSMAPSARIFAYYIYPENIYKGELVADSLNFHVDGAFDRNPVAISYSKQSAEPGDNVDVQVTAVSGSMVGLLAVDQSVILLGGGNDITQADVLSELRSYDSFSKSSPTPSSGYPYGVGGTDSYTMMSNAGLIALFYNERKDMLTTTPQMRWFSPPIAVSPPPRGPRPTAFTLNLPRAITGAPPPVFSPIMKVGTHPPPSLEPSLTTRPGPTPAAAEQVVVRKSFPESWLWSNITSVNGTVIVNTVVPDTITSWVASAFAVSSEAGLGVSADTAKIQVFRPFFISLNLPYSVVRGEQLVLQAIVFNYMNRDANVTITLPASEQYKSIVVSASGRTRNVKQTETVTVRARANQGTTVSFPIVPSVIGKMRVKVTAVTDGARDAVQRDLLVEAEGVEQEYNQAIMINLKNNSTFTQTVKIDFPPNVVSDSSRVEFSVIGDVMGPSINGLEHLIKMPYGCGEQNMLNFAPTVFVTEYLTQAKQLTSKLKSKSVRFMEAGYQRELTYQRNDGSYSAFGKRDPSGSMWLTAFVAKSFQKAGAFIFVDEEVLLRAVDWMIRRQNPDGSFPEPGRIIHKGMMGGASSTVTLTAFVLTAISEVQLRSTEIAPRLTTAKSKAQAFLEGRASSLSDPYSLALTSYALFKSGSSNVDKTLQPLEKLAKIEGNFKHWVQPQDQPVTNSRIWRPPHRQSKAIDIELAAYVLQLEVERSHTASAVPILEWLSAQRNSNGGFSSTQDTVVALQALAKFASKSVRGHNMSISVLAAGQTHNYSIRNDNHLVLQSRVLDPNVKTVRIDATGFGSALAQVSATYNIEDYEQEPAFDTKATVLNEKDNSLTIRVCTRWLLSGNTGMAVKEIGIPSGFSADIEGLELKNYNGVKRVEEGDRKVIIYFDELGSIERCVDVDAERTGLVAKARPVAVRVYDYYEPENQQTIFYSSTRLNNINICDVCGATCEGCTAYFKRK